MKAFILASLALILMCPTAFAGDKKNNPAMSADQAGAEICILLLEAIKPVREGMYASKKENDIRSSLQGAIAQYTISGSKYITPASQGASATFDPKYTSTRHRIVRTMITEWITNRANAMNSAAQSTKNAIEDKDRLEARLTELKKLHKALEEKPGLLSVIEAARRYQENKHRAETIGEKQDPALAIRTKALLAEYSITQNDVAAYEKVISQISDLELRQAAWEHSPIEKAQQKVARAKDEENLVDMSTRYTVVLQNLPIQDNEDLLDYLVRLYIRTRDTSENQHYFSMIFDSLMHDQGTTAILVAETEVKHPKEFTMLMASREIAEARALQKSIDELNGQMESILSSQNETAEEVEQQKEKIESERKTLQSALEKKIDEARARVSTGIGWAIFLVIVDIVINIVK